MAPPRRRTRKDADQDTKPAMGKPTAIATESGRGKRRKVNPSQNTRAAAAEPNRGESLMSEETIDNQQDPESRGEWTAQLSLVDQVVANLRTASQPVNAATDYANEVVDSMDGDYTAYGRICGRTWRFLMKKTSIIIGRPRAPSKVLNSDGADMPRSADQPENGSSGGNFDIDIDLGPDHQISRVHAEVTYDTEEAKWKLVVNGRNGALLDDLRLERGDVAVLHSGAVISIMGTQMLFQTPQDELRIHPSIMRQTESDGTETDEQEAEEEEETKEHVRPPPAHAPAGRGTGNNLHSSQNFTQSGSQQNARGSGRGRAAPNSQPGTPLTNRSGTTQPRSKQSPAYSRGMMLESTEDIDFSLDSSKDLKPPHSYAALIGDAILSTEDHQMALANIYQHIKDNYAFYRHNGGGWQNSIRHNLSLSKVFEKVPRRTDEPGKGMKWQIAAEHKEDYLKKRSVSARRGGRRINSSVPNSPAAGPSIQTKRLQGVINAPAESSRGVKRPSTADSEQLTSPHSLTPPPKRQHLADDSFTPERNPKARHHESSMPGYTNGRALAFTPKNARTQPSIVTNDAANATGGPTSAEPVSATSTHSAATSGIQALTEAAAATANSPPSLLATGNRNSTFHGYDGALTTFATPLINRQQPHLPPPSTARMPSHYAQLSSPAPFWKYADMVPNTPMDLKRLNGWSPIKKEKNLSDAENEAGDSEENEGDDTVLALEGENVKKIGSQDMEMSDAADATTKKPSDDDDSSMPQPSSPPLLSDPKGDDAEDELQDMSPSRTISRPVSSREDPKYRNPFPKLDFNAQPKFDNADKKLGANTNGNIKSTTGLSFDSAQSAMQRGTTAGGFGGAQGGGDEEEGIDLAKGFQKIGSFHRNLHANAVPLGHHPSQQRRSEAPPSVRMGMGMNGL
ncbi:hypothetical protein K402DRAFT_420881 [Aulographum hederae CBS 113979]|uniref:Fork-head domain-containing protein n=1 Tax=Aulographum hederae CBS 113979 TaxID=1176131 RepID=A0A6G1H1D6_9PEZI|nr:hypothetical protein K402DRAFT_420881 [Aulographum hederae CBS 113979]